MKTSVKTTIILKAIDMQLKDFLVADLKNYKIARETKQVAVKKAA